MWLVYAKIWYTYTYYINGNDLVSLKWPKMTIDVWSDNTEKQDNGIWAVFEGIFVHIMPFLVCRQYTCILKSTEQTVYVPVYEQIWQFLTGIQLVYGILLYI